MPDHPASVPTERYPDRPTSGSEDRHPAPPTRASTESDQAGPVPGPAEHRRPGQPAPGSAPRDTGRSPRVGPRGLYRAVASAEMITWALLILGMLGKYVLGLGDLPVRIGGSIHGFVFLSYCVSTVVVWTDQRWPAAKGIAGLALAIVPFATAPFERHVDRAGLLSDRWRVAAAGTGPAARARGGDEPARTAAERLLAVILRRPVLSALVLAVFVAALFTLLLQAGPPTEWFA